MYARCPLEVCEARDPKGLYRQARRHPATTLPGIGPAFEEPADADATVDTECRLDPQELNGIIRRLL